MREIVTRITEITGSIASLHATGVGLGELAEIQSPGRKTLGQVIRVSGDMVTLQVFGGTKGLSTNDHVRFLGHPMQVKYGESIGVASSDIQEGQLVHVHNLEGARGRGDLVGEGVG